MLSLASILFLCANKSAAHGGPFSVFDMSSSGEGSLSTFILWSKDLGREHTAGGCISLVWAPINSLIAVLIPPCFVQENLYGRGLLFAAWVSYAPWQNPHRNRGWGWSTRGLSLMRQLRVHAPYHNLSECFPDKYLIHFQFSRTASHKISRIICFRFLLWPLFPVSGFFL